MTSPLTNWPRLDLSRLIALTLESCFNGVFWMFFYECNLVLYRRAKARSERFLKPISITGWVLFCCIFSHFILDIYTATAAFIIPPGEPCQIGPFSHATLFYLVLDHPSNVAYSAIYVLTTVIADAFLIYRLYVVWNDNRLIIIPPIFFCAGLLVTGIMVTFLFDQARQPIFGIARRWILACYILTFLCNSYSTILIAVKLTIANKNAQTIGANSVFQKILEVVIQSAAIYCVLVVLSLSFMSVSSNLTYITVSITIPTIGIIFSMIVTRTHDHLATQRAGQHQFTNTNAEFVRPREPRRKPHLESQVDSTDVDSRTWPKSHSTIESGLSSPNVT